MFHLWIKIKMKNDLYWSWVEIRECPHPYKRKMRRSWRWISWDALYFISEAETNRTKRGFEDRVVLSFYTEETATQTKGIWKEWPSLGFLNFQSPSALPSMCDFDILCEVYLPQKIHIYSNISMKCIIKLSMTSELGITVTLPSYQDG